MNTFNDTKKSGPRRNDAGQALVELAIALPVLLLLVFGIIEFGRALYIKNTLTSAARAGVRAAVVRTCVDHEYSAGELSTTRSDTDIVQQKIYDCIINVPDKNQAYATIDVVGKSGITPALPDDTVTATVSVPFNTLVPGLLKMLRPNNTAMILVGSASMRFE